MKITVANSEKQFYDMAALRIGAQILEKPDSIIGFSTGRTTKGIHAALAALYRQSAFDAGKARVFGLDEITNMSRECPASCYYILLHQVVEPLDIPMEHFIMPDPYPADANAESADFAERIAREGRVDLQILGIGENGHIGFNQPGTPFGQRAWISYMDDSLDSRLRKENNIPAGVPMGGLTLGIRDVMESRRILLTANGASKAEIIKRALFGPVTEEVPSSVLQLHPECEVLLDPAAASLL